MTVKRSFTYNGKRYYVRGETEREALEKLTLLREKVEKDEIINPSLRTVRSWAIECVEVYKVRQSEITRRKYLAKMESCVLKHIGDLRLSKVTPIQCQNVLNQQIGKSQNYINTTYQMLKFIFGMAKINRMIRSDPTERLVKPQGTYTPRRSLTVNEEKYFCEAVKSHDYGLYFAFMYYAGCRPQEAASLEGRDIQIENGQPMLHIRGTKTAAADRMVPIVPELMALIPSSRPAYKRLCMNLNGKPITTQNHRRAWSSFKREMQILAGCRLYRNELVPPFPLDTDSISPYSLRHTFCTNLQKAGVDIRTAQYLMGHASIEMTANIYTHVDMEIIEAAGKLMCAK